MTTSNMKGVACSDRSTKNSHPAALTFLASFRPLFWFLRHISYTDQSHHSHQPCFQQQQAAVFSEKKKKNAPSRPKTCGSV